MDSARILNASPTLFHVIGMPDGSFNLTNLRAGVFYISGPPDSSDRSGTKSDINRGTLIYILYSDYNFLVT